MIHGTSCAGTAYVVYVLLECTQDLCLSAAPFPGCRHSVAHQGLGVELGRAGREALRSFSCARAEDMNV